MKLSILILAGGEGTRFQPVSTPDKPKQFLNLVHPEKSMMQQTWERAATLAKPQDIWIATNERYVPLIKKDLPQAMESHIIGETQKKNTAPAIALVTWMLANKDPDTILVVFPSDHFIDDTNLFSQTIQTAVDAAKKFQGIVTLGIIPREASTQYGYIHRGKELDTVRKLFQVRGFTEKPIRHRADKFLADGNYFWNSGMFIFPVGLMKEEMIRCHPPIAEALAGLKDFPPKREFLEWFFETVSSISIDYAVMEKTDRAMMIPASFFWSDVGSWEGLAELSKKQPIVIPAEIKAAMTAELQGQS